jgi:hypothetical protein
MGSLLNPYRITTITPLYDACQGSGLFGFCALLAGMIATYRRRDWSANLAHSGHAVSFS